MNKEDRVRRYFREQNANALEFSGQGELNRSVVMGMIQRFIDNSFKLWIRPLSHLQRCFPKYEWRCYTLEETNGITGTIIAITHADFSWLCASDGSCIIAVLPSRKKRLARCFYTSEYCVGRTLSLLTKGETVFVTDDNETRKWLKESKISFEKF